MKIARVTSTPVAVTARIDILDQVKQVRHGMCLVEVETDTGLIGQGMTAITQERIVHAAIEQVAGPAILGDDPLAHNRVWDKLYWLLAPRGQTGIALHTIAAIDVALWDIKGQALGEPVWRLLGGSRDRIPVYATFGFDFFDRDELVEAARRSVGRGFRRLKMTVGHGALARRDEPRPMLDVIREDARRIEAVREAVGADVELYIDANCGLDLFHAQKLCELIEPFDIAFFEEPITQNDVRQMADLRRRTSIPLACGQNEGLAYRFRDLLIAGAVDVVQPNVVISGGFTQAQRIAALAQAFNVGIDNGGSWPYHNMHLQAGVSNGGMFEYHYPAVECCRQIFRPLTEPDGGWMALPHTPGLGFKMDPVAARELAGAES